MLKKLFSRPVSQPSHRQPVIVVSGLPRSGTSMMMKMLAKGGVEVVSDHQRTADDDNPDGYFEFELVKKLGENQTQWLGNAQGKVVKIISSLLEFLPRDYQYKIIFMERDLQEVLVSQQKMLRNRQEQTMVSDVELRTQFEKHLAAIKYWLARQPNMEVTYVKYNEVVLNPEYYANHIAQFIDQPLNIDDMMSVPNQSLYRNRKKD